MLGFDSGEVGNVLEVEKRLSGRCEMPCSPVDIPHPKIRSCWLLLYLSSDSRHEIVFLVPPNGVER